MTIRFAILLLGIGILLPEASAQRREFCVVCGKGPLVGSIWKHPQHGTICQDCYRRDLRCDICSLPILDNYLKTRDGRFICKFEKDDVVVDEKQAQLIFRQSVQSLLYVTRDGMRLRGPAPDVRLFDIDYWNSGSSMRRGGFSQTRQVGDRYTHNVILLSGLPKDELVSVCAHEYTHLWINENRASDRVIETNTVEAICELLAYKVAERAGFTNQLERIQKNPYTQGRIADLLEADRQYGLAEILRWVKTGRNATVSLSGVRSSAPAPSPAPSPAARRAPAPAPPAVAPPSPASSPTGLTLAAIVRTARGYRAQINGVFFMAGDLKRVTHNGRPANLQCLRVTADGALVSLNRGRPQTLRLGK